MNQVSRPMQILLAAVLLLAAAWFTVLKPNPDGDVIDTPVATTAGTTPPVAAGGAAAESAVGKVIETANNGAAAANDAVAKSEAQTGETDPNATSPQGDAAATGSADAEQSGSASPSAASKAAASQKAETDKKVQQTIRTVKREMKAGRPVVLFIYEKGGIEDKLVATQMKRIRGAAKSLKVITIPAKKIGAYDPLVGSLSIGQVPATVVIAPDGTAKVIGGYTSTVRITRLINAAGKIKPVDEKQ